MTNQKVTNLASSFRLTFRFMALLLVFGSAIFLNSCSKIEMPESDPQAALSKSEIKALNETKMQARAALENLSNARGSIDPANPNNPLDQVGLEHNAVMNSAFRNWGTLSVPCLDCEIPNWMVSCTKYYNDCFDDILTETNVVNFVLNATGNSGISPELRVALNQGGNSIFKALNTPQQTFSNLYQAGKISTFDYNLLIVLIDELEESYGRSGISGAISTVNTFEDAITVRGLQATDDDFLLGTFAVMKYSALLWDSEVAHLPPSDQIGTWIVVVMKDVAGFGLGWLFSNGTTDEEKLKDATGSAIMTSLAAAVEEELSL